MGTDTLAPEDSTTFPRGLVHGPESIYYAARVWLLRETWRSLARALLWGAESRLISARRPFAVSAACLGLTKTPLPALGCADEVVLAKVAFRSHRRAEGELAALEARHHGFGARRCDDGARRLLDVAQAILRELSVGHAPFYPDAI